MAHALLHGPLPLFIAQTIAIIVCSRLLGRLARALGQPMVVAEIIAGVLLGPSLLGLFAPSLEGALFPKASMPLLGMLSQVGLILFMFLIGLELDPKLLRGRAHSSVAISHTSIALPFVLGALLAVRLYPTLAPASVALLPFTLFMGAAMSITAFPVLARILVERRILHSRIGAIAIACAAVDDVTAWCILAFVVSVARSAQVLDAVRTCVFALGYILIMFFVVRPALARFAERTKLGLSQNLVALTLVLLLVSSWITELIGIHALFGAFLFGAILPKQGSFSSAFAEKIEDLVVVFLLPLFFAYSGLRTELGLLNSAGSWLTCAVVIALASVGKFGGSTLAARLTGMTLRESSAIGVLMNTRGLMELVVLNIGLDLGVISPKLFTMMVIMALVTTFATTPLLNLIYPIELMIRELSDAGEPPAQAATERYTALLCVSFERTGPALMTLGAAIAGSDPALTRVYALRLIRPANRASFVLEQHGQAQPLEEHAGLQPLLERAEELNVNVRPLSFVSGTPGQDICDVAAVKQADIVLLGWHKPMFGATMLSGTVHDVMSNAAPLVGVLVDRGFSRLERLLVPYLGSEHDRAALLVARRIAEHRGAKLTVLRVVESDDEQARTHALADLERELGPDLAEKGIEARLIRSENAVETVLSHSALGFDLLIVGIGRQWGLEHRSFGFQAEALLKRSPTSVLVVRNEKSANVSAEAG